jgi:DNA transformation protein
MKPLYFLFALAVLALPAPAQEVEIMKKMVTGGTQPLTDMPNIGRELAGLLARAGIRTPEELRRVGAVEAAVRIKSIRPDDPPCRSMFAGLDGAIRGVRWRTIPKAARDALELHGVTSQHSTLDWRLECSWIEWKQRGWTRC